MINYLRIQNFKCWKDTGTITMSPLTTFFGSNSSGKSSIGQFLMLLKQSVDLSDRKTVLFPGNENTAVDLGIPSEMVYNRDINEPITFSYQWDLDEPFQFQDAIKLEKYSCNKIEFSATIKVKDLNTQILEVDSLTYTLFIKDKENIEISMVKNLGSRRGYSLMGKNYNLVRSTGRVWDIKSPIRFYGFPDEAVAYYQNADFLQGLNFQHEKLFSSIFYLGPLRTKAKRLYPWAGVNPDSVGFFGENTISAMLSAKAESREINYKYKGSRKSFEVVVADMLKKMDLIEDFKVERIENRQEYDVKVKTYHSDNWVDIPDVGFGVSQVLPVVVQLFYAPKGSTIIMEQPEIHLHPNAQAALADIMITAINSREDHKNRNIQLIVETHSEHFLRRLQRRIAEEEIDPTLINAYFVNNESSPPALDSLQVDSFGNIVNWPNNFFGDISGDIFKQTEATLKRRMKEYK